MPSVLAAASVAGKPAGFGVRFGKSTFETGQKAYSDAQNTEGGGIKKAAVFVASFGINAASEAIQAGIRTVGGRTHSHTAQSMRYEREKRDANRSRAQGEKKVRDEAKSGAASENSKTDSSSKSSAFAA